MPQCSDECSYQPRHILTDVDTVQGQSEYWRCPGGCSIGRVTDPPKLAALSEVMKSAAELLSVREGESARGTPVMYSREPGPPETILTGGGICEVYLTPSAMTNDFQFFHQIGHEAVHTFMPLRKSDWFAEAMACWHSVYLRATATPTGFRSYQERYLRGRGRSEEAPPRGFTDAFRLAHDLIVTFERAEVAGLASFARVISAAPDGNPEEEATDWRAWAHSLGGDRRERAEAFLRERQHLHRPWSADGLSPCSATGRLA